MLHKPFLFATHLAATCTLTFILLYSLICIARDSGSVGWGAEETEDQEMKATEALMSADDDLTAPGRCCRKCWVVYHQHMSFNTTFHSIFAGQSPLTQHATTAAGIARIRNKANYSDSPLLCTPLVLCTVSICFPSVIIPCNIMN